MRWTLQGRSVVTWYTETGDGSGSAAFAQRLDAQGALLGREFRVNMTTYSQQGPGGVVMLPGGSFVVTFDSATDANGNGSVFNRRFFFPRSLALAPGDAAANPPLAIAERPDGLSGSAPFAP